MKKYFFLLLTAGVLWSTMSCGKPPVFDDVPSISFNSFSTDTVGQFDGIVTLIINFTDGDGDLGTEEDTIKNMLVIDTRGNDTTYYRIPEIPQQGVASGINGEIEVDMSQVCCVLPGYFPCSEVPEAYDEVVYKVKIKDNADRWSNEIETPPLKVRCFSN